MAAFLGLDEEEMQIFLAEMDEHIEVLETELLSVEDRGAVSDQVARLFRAAHTIKGTAATVGLDSMATLTHAMETLFDQMRTGTLAPGAAVVNLLLQAVDYLRDALSHVQAGSYPSPAPESLEAALDAAAERRLPEMQPADNETGDKVKVDNNQKPLLNVEVQFDPDCQLPAVRALQVLLALKTLGNVVGSDPDEAAIRSGQIQGLVCVGLETDSTDGSIRTALQRISDVAQVEITECSAMVSSPQHGATTIQNEDTAQQPAVLTAEPTPAQTPLRQVPRSNAGDERGMGGDRTIRVDVGLLDDLMNLVGELVIDRGRLGGIGQSLEHADEVTNLADELGQVTAHLARVTGTLQETVLKARMLPIKLVFKKFPRMVHDLAQQLEKQVSFHLVGEETELDRSLLEVLGDPLMHLLRNALDHGIESVAERRRVGKPEVATLQLSAGYEENQVVILVQDDGRGIDSNAVKNSAVRKGLLTAERAREMDEQDAIQLLFMPGFSTSEKVSDISGRGVGLDVVRKDIERVGGRIEVESQLGYGCTFRLLLPLTLATIQALLVQVGRDILALPLSSTAEVVHVEPAGLSLVGGRWLTQVRERVVPLLWLEQFLSPHFQPQRPKQQFVAVLVSYKGEPMGLVVDHLIGEQEVVVKGLGEFFGQMKGISGVTILGDGKLALILDTAGLVSALATPTRGIGNRQAL